MAFMPKIEAGWIVTENKTNKQTKDLYVSQFSGHYYIRNLLVTNAMFPYGCLNSEEKSTRKCIEHMSAMHETLIAVLNAAK